MGNSVYWSITLGGGAGASDIGVLLPVPTLHEQLITSNKVVY